MRFGVRSSLAGFGFISMASFAPRISFSVFHNSAMAGQASMGPGNKPGSMNFACHEGC
jgi:hypothetical protein